MHSPRISLVSALAAVVLVSALATGAAPDALAAVDIDFGAAVNVGDDASIYLAVSSRYYDRDAGDMGRWERRCGGPDDLAVAMFICRRSHATPGQVIALRVEGLDWWAIGVRFGVPVDAWFVPVQRDPGPPYGKAYGHWRQRRWGDDDRPFSLSDDDARNLVAVRFLHEYYGVSVEAAMEWRSSGHSLRDLTAGEYRNRHGKGKGAAARAGSGAGSSGLGGAPAADHGKGHEKGHDKGKGKEKK